MYTYMYVAEQVLKLPDKHKSPYTCSSATSSSPLDHYEQCVPLQEGNKNGYNSAIIYKRMRLSVCVSIQTVWLGSCAQQRKVPSIPLFNMQIVMGLHV